MASDDPILVTGATGFVGAAVARALLEQGARVRVTARASSPRANLAGLDAEIVEADMRDSAAMRRALKGVRGFYHVAADYRLWAPDPEDIVRANVEGTRTAMEAALAEGVPRIVYTSSVATLQIPHGADGDEDHPLDPSAAIGAYKRSKTAAERVVEAMVAERGLNAVIVNPSTPIGPRDVKPTPTGRIVLEGAGGRLPAFVDTGLNLVHVDDVAAGHLQAFEKGEAGARYILGGTNVSLREMLAAVAKIVGRKAPSLNLPRGPLYPLACAAEAIARVSGKEPMLTRDALKMSRHHMFFSSAKAQAALGYRYRPYEEALSDAVDWFKSAGYLK